MSAARASGNASFSARLTKVAAWSTWLVIAVTFVGLLGGTHPSDAVRDRVIVVASIIVCVLSGAVVLTLMERARTHAPTRELVTAGLMLVVRIVVAVVVLRFIGSISHEYRPRDIQPAADGG